MRDDTTNGLEPPVLHAYPDARGHLRVWCSHCKRWRQHGKGEGHRAAHCTSSESPYRQAGYTLRAVGQTKQEIFEAVLATLEFRYNEKNPLAVLFFFDQHDWSPDQWQQIEKRLCSLLSRVQRMARALIS